MPLTASCFGHKTVGPNQREQAEDGEECISPKSSVDHERWSDETNDEVVQPV